MKLPAALNRKFRLVAFDWDGTAVENRAADAAPVRRPIERLLRVGVIVVVITGTNLRNVDAQLSRAIRGRHKQSLFLATNRGSEVFGFGASCEPRLLFRHEATEKEERALSEIAESVCEELVARTGLDVRVIYDRLNRRKIDLIPLEAWRDPPKSELGALLVAVETRLRGAGMTGGVREAIELARAHAREKGLAEAKITSDVKHVEIGLTDKGDSVRWMMRELAAARGIAAEDVLIGGDEFGAIAGFSGSDSRMLIPEARGATFVSVGPEPSGAPEGVLHLGGGPERFRQLVEALAALHPVTLPATPERDPAWTIVEDGFVLAREHEIESLFATSNGFVGARAALVEGSPLSTPSTFVAGVFDSHPGAGPGLARAPDWPQLGAEVVGVPLKLDVGEPLHHRRVLDMRNGIAWREWRHRDPAGRITRIEGLRLASLADRHLLLQSITLTPENYGGVVTIEAPALARGVSMTTSTDVRVDFVAESRIEDPEGRWQEPPPAPRDGQPTERWPVEVEMGKTYRLDRVACVSTSRDGGCAEGTEHDRLRHALEEGVARLVEAHREAWRARWDASDVVVEGDPAAQRALRFAIYHLVGAANPDDERVSIGARALTGPAYRGHVFWDTEIYMLPFFTLTYPEAARALLMYRYHTLPAARARAARFGYRGALYAWESADTGDDVTPRIVVSPTGELIRIRVGEEEQHISADVAYAVDQYWRATGDDRFFAEAGAEILFETARFWASRATREDDDRHHIRGVIGPDEYHESVDDDAYTNGMAQWNLRAADRAALELARRAPERWNELSQRLHLSSDELRGWRRIADDMHLAIDPSTGVIEQFEGYFGLEDIDVRAHEPRTAPMDVILGRERTMRSKVIKQPDVVMLIHLLWDQFAPEIREASFRYYERYTSHGSSLSPSIHAAVAAKLGDADLAMRYFRQSADIDLSNTMGNAAGGVHAAALGGLWQAAIFGFAGLTLTGAGPELHPQLPAEWTRLRSQILWRGEHFPIDVRQRPPVARPSDEVRP